MPLGGGFTILGGSGITTSLNGSEMTIATDGAVVTETSTDTLEEVVLKFSTKEKAINYAKKNNISYKIIEPKKKEFVIKSYADNFFKD